jgi:hypothetical protein
MPLLTAGTWQGIRNQRNKTLVQTADVYALNRLTGKFDTLIRAGLACRLAMISAETATNGNERTDMLSRRRLVWDGSYAMPEGSQVTIDGQSWRPVRGTFANYQDEYGISVHRAADVIRQDT